MEDNTWYGLLIGIAGLIIGLAKTWITDLLKIRTEADRDVEIAKLDITKEEHEAIKENLRKALETCQELKTELSKEKELRRKIETKFDAVKKVYNVIFTQYALQFKDDPEQISMLESLKNIINE